MAEAARREFADLSVEPSWRYTPATRAELPALRLNLRHGAGDTSCWMTA